MARIFENGIYENLDINFYHAAKGISNSGLNLILDAPAKYYYEYLSGLCVKKDTESKSLGSAVHCLVLEPHLFEKNFYLLDEKFNLRSNASKTLWSDILKSGKKPIRQKEFKEAGTMAYAIRQNKAFDAIITSRQGKVEDSLFWQHESGITLKSRPDWYSDDLIIDVKTTKSAKSEKFNKSIGEYGYHRQAYLSTEGLTKITGREYKKVLLVAVENKAPYLTKTYLIGEESIQKGKEEVERAIEIYHECLESNVWPSYGDTIETIELHKFYRGILDV